MPRTKIISNLVKDSGGQLLRKTSKVSPAHITIFSSEQEGQNLLQSFPDIKVPEKRHQIQRAKSKFTKAYLKLQASAIDAEKFALSSNQIRFNQNCFVLNKKLIVAKNDSQSQAKQFLERVRSKYTQKNQILQKFNQIFQAYQVQKVECELGLNGKWSLDDSQMSNNALSEGYQILINPTIIYGSQLQTRYEECISFPFLDFMIPRYNKLLLHYYDGDLKSKFIYSNGFVSRVIQHHCQHLQGKVLLDWRINHGQLSLNNSVERYFPKSMVVVEQYSRALNSIFKQFPELIFTSKQYALKEQKLEKLFCQVLKIPQQKQKGQRTQMVPSRIKKSVKNSFDFAEHNNFNSDFSINKNEGMDLLSFEDDYVTRIVKHFKKQFIKFDQKIEMGLIDFESINQNKNNQVSELQTIYNQEQYSKSIKITYLNAEINSKLSKGKNLYQQQKKPLDIQDHAFDQDYQMPDEQLSKLLSKQKKSKNKKK